jgi:hypothetical protein
MRKLSNPPNVVENGCRDTLVAGPAWARADTPPYPAFANLEDWGAISGLSRSASYLALGAGNLRAKKIGRRLLIDVAHGLEWRRSQPDARFRDYRSPAKQQDRSAQV